MSNDRQRLVSAARRLLPSRADAEDAVQDAYVRALTALDGAPPEPAWMYTVLRNIAIDRLRRQRFEAEHAEAEPAPGRSPEEQLRLRADCEAALRHLLGRTSLAEAAAILLRDVFELDYAEIARLVGKTEPACRQFLQRARTRTRRGEASTEAEEIHVRRCWQAIEARDPGRLVEMTRMPATGMALLPRSLLKGRRSDARSHTRLVQVNGRYALAVVLDGTVLCVVPVGAQAAAESAGLETG
jgi:RNA polymerase sigma-70 factor (ECF subfamily)